jgi:aminoglycoside phosphotransferase (APT) family kinase protein
VDTVRWVAELEAALGQRVQSMHLLPGGASKEAWAVDANGVRLLVRRAGGGVIHEATLSLEQEFRVLEAAHEAGVKVPKPVAYLGELGGREAFAMERVEGETIGRRIVRGPPPRLDVQLAEELAKIHAIPPQRLPFLYTGDVLERFEHELDLVEEPHPALEYGLWWLRKHRPEPLPDVVTHGDFRIGNVVVSEDGLVSLLDWEFAHLSDPREDLAWPIVRAWRFGADDKRLGGVGELGAYLRRYAELTGRQVGEEELYWWEVLGNLKWAVGCLNQSRRHLRGLDRSVEYAVLGRMAAEMEYELLHLIEHA